MTVLQYQNLLYFIDLLVLWINREVFAVSLQKNLFNLFVDYIEKNKEQIDVEYLYRFDVIISKNDDGVIRFPKFNMEIELV